MNTKIIRKIISILLCLSTIAAYIPDSVYAYEAVLYQDSTEHIIETELAEDITDTTMDILEAMKEKLAEDGIVLNLYEDNLPSRKLLTDTGYVPIVGNQGQTTTCASFSTTYYQYAYEANRVNSTNDTYSPFYMFSYGFRDIVSIYRHLKERGCIKYDEWEHTGQAEKTNGDVYWTRNLVAMRKALNTRVSHYYKYYEDHMDQEAGNVQDKTRVIKTLIANGYMLVVTYGVNGVSVTNAVDNKETAKYEGNDEVVYRAGVNDGGHAVTIIGYDDNIGADVNGDGSIEENEKGAFKVRNSWGEDAHKGGDFWVLYEAVVSENSSITTTDDILPVSDVAVKKVGTAYVLYKNGEATDIRYAHRDDLQSFVDNIPCIPKNEDGLCAVQWLWTCAKDITNNSITEDENDIIEKWYSDNQEKWEDILEDYKNSQKAESSKLPKNWDEIMTCFKGTREKMFTANWEVDENRNNYNFIKVEHKDVQIVGQVAYNMTNCSDYNITFSNIKDGHIESKTMPNRGAKEHKIEATEVFDLTELVSDTDDLLGSQQWKATLTLGDNNTGREFEFLLTDNLGKKIVPEAVTMAIDEGDKTAELTLTTNLQPCDVNYDGNFDTSDLNIIFRGLIRSSPYSELQKLLGDYNEDGYFNEMDYDELIRYVEGCITNGDNSQMVITQEQFESHLNTCVRLTRDGDNNYDDYITPEDFDNLRYYLSGDTGFNPLQEKLFDYNSDGEVNDTDVYEMLDLAAYAILKGTRPDVRITSDQLYGILSDLGYKNLGDVTNDGVINGQDIVLLEDMLSGTEVSFIQRFMGDVNRDGQLDRDDIRQLCKEALFVDINGNGLYTVEDIYAVRNHFSGDTLPLTWQNRVDFNADGQVGTEEFYMLIYGYYLNMDSNKDLPRSQFYGELAWELSLNLGNMNSWGGIDEVDLELFNQALAGTPVSYLHLILADMDKNLQLDEADADIFHTEYMSDIPFTYILDEEMKTITLTGVKDNTVTYLRIPKQYIINCETYQVTAIAENAFSDCMDLEEVYIPDSVAYIAGSKAAESPFAGIEGYVLKIYCEAPERPEGYGRYWASGQRVTYGYTMKNIEDYFEYTADTENKTLTINGVKGSWYRDTNDTITIDDRYLLNGEEYRVTAIGDYALYYVGMGGEIRTIVLPAGITVIGEWAFADNEYLEDIDLGRCTHLKEIKASAFAYCSHLIEVWIPSSVEIIDSHTVEDSIFYECNEDMVIYVGSSTSKEGWGEYWNYIQENMIAETFYEGSGS